ncbi:MAG: 50S ribosomal protein L11 methyltransferase [Prolixibacteraceae bacterium]
MTYQKATLVISPDNQENRDILIALLSEKGFESFVETEENIEAYIPEDLHLSVKIDQFEMILPFKITFEMELIPDQNWNEVWEKNYFKPLLFADQCVIRAPFHTDFPKAKYEIIIEPNMAFGTGNHETTALMIEHILELNVPDKKILDMGCGTGILSILASKRHAKSILSIDIDTWSYEGTRENAALNNCSNIEVLHGDASLLGKQSFDYIFANIHKNVLIDDMSNYATVLKSNGTILLSGFYENDLQDIVDVALHNGLNLISYKSKNKWVAAKFQKN